MPTPKKPELEPPPGVSRLADQVPVKVQAQRMGFYDEIRRRVGDVFTLKDPAHFSTTWMRIVPGSTPERITSGQQELRRQHTEEMQSRAQAASVAPLPGVPTGAADPLADR